MKKGDVVEIYFYRSKNLMRALGEVKNHKNNRVHLLLWDTSSPSLIEWDEVVIRDSEILEVQKDIDVIPQFDGDCGVH